MKNPTQCFFPEKGAQGHSGTQSQLGGSGSLRNLQKFVNIISWPLPSHTQFFHEWETLVVNLAEEHHIGKAGRK